MTIEAIATFVRLYDDNNFARGNYQNSNTTTPITFESEGYAFLPFIYNGATKSRSGDNIESLLTLASNEISLSLAHEAIKNFWTVKVSTVLMHPQTFQPNRTLSQEYWTAASMSYNVDGVQIRLGSAIDAIGATVPNKVLTRKAVGALPITSQIRNS
jgi:hypothetical protein